MALWIRKAGLGAVLSIFSCPDIFLVLPPISAKLSVSETSRPTIALASMGAVASEVAKCSTTLPWRMIVISSVAAKISFSLWLTKATQRFSSSTTCRSTLKRRSDSEGLKTDVGSSRIIIFGSYRKHLMISTRWRTPTGRSRTRVSGSTFNPYRAEISEICCRVLFSLLRKPDRAFSHALWGTFQKELKYTF